MRSMTGYGHGETDYNGTKFTVELNTVNRKQSDIVINLPRDLVALASGLRAAAGLGETWERRQGCRRSQENAIHRQVPSSPVPIRA